MASFTTTIKDEITKLENNKLESLAELAAYMYFNAKAENGITVYIENASVARKVFNLLKKLYGVSINLTTRTSKKFKVRNIYILNIKDKTDVINSDILEMKKNIKSYSLEEQAGFLRGTFLAKGSINDPSKSKYHLEFLIEDESDSELVSSLLKGFNFNSKIIKREKGYMVYVKASEEISDFIKLMGAINALFYYEDIRIYRDHKNMVNRLNNCEQANVEKSMKTCYEQIAQINYLKENDLLSLLDDKTNLIVEYRLKYPETSMQELADIVSLETDYKITKSGINHHFRKIKELVNRARSRG